MIQDNKEGIVKVFIVWNTVAKEGLAFDNRKDAESVLSRSWNQPAIAGEYMDCYPDDNVIVERNVDLP